MEYYSFTRKQVRLLKRDIEVLFQLKISCILPTSIEVLKEHGFFAPKLSLENGEVILSQVGKEALRRFVHVLYESPALNPYLIYNDIYSLTLKHVSSWVDRKLLPDFDEFWPDFEAELRGKIKNYTFMYVLEGLKLVDIESMATPSFKICEFRSELLTGIESKNSEVNEWVPTIFGESYVIVGSAVGSEKSAKETFEARANLVVSTLQLFHCLVSPQQIRNTKLWLVTSSFGGHRTADHLYWEENRKVLCVSRQFFDGFDFEISKEILIHTEEHCFSGIFWTLIFKETEGEFFDSIRNSLYWFGEAVKDRDNTMKFIKLWSCAESFFSIESVNLGETNAACLAAALIYGGYGVKKPEEFQVLKTRVKELYQYRSKALHRARYGRISDGILEEFSQMIAYLLLTMAGLCEKGYTKNREVVEVCLNLSKKHNEEKMESE